MLRKSFGLVNSLSFNKIISVFLCVCLVITTPYIQLLAETPDLSALKPVIGEKNFDEVVNYVERVESLRESFASSTAAPSHPLDPFLLLEQTLIDRRREMIEAKKAHIQATDFEVRKMEEIAFLTSEMQKDYARTVQLIGEENVFEAAKKVGVDPQTGLEQILEAAKTDDTVAEMIGITPEQLEDFIGDPESVSPRRLYQMNLQLQIFDEHDKIRFTVDQKEFIGSTAYGFHSQAIFNDRTPDTFKFKIANRNGEPLHDFHRPVDAVGFFGKYLVYIEKGSYDPETGALPLRFIDLDYFKGAIGNANLPVFTLPLRSNSPFQKMEILNGELKINDLPGLNVVAFDFLVDNLYRGFFNLSVGLVDPRTHSSAEHLINELTYLFDRSLGEADEFVGRALVAGVGGLDEAQQMVQQAQTVLNHQARAGNTDVLKESVEQIKEYEDLVLQFNPTIKSIETEVLRRESLMATNRHMMVSRKFLSRLHMLAARLTHPQPKGSPKLLKAMAMVAEGLAKRQPELRQAGVAELQKNPIFKYGKYGAGVLAAAMIGPHLPEPVAFNLYQGLDLISAMYEHAIGYLHHINFGANYLRLMGTSAETVASGLPSVPDAYLTSEKLPKLALLLTATVSLPFMIFAVPHLVVNSVKAVRSMKQHAFDFRNYIGEGRSRLSALKQMFIDYQQRERAEYDRIQAEAESALSGGPSTFNEAQDAVAREYIEQLKAKNGGYTSRLMNGGKTLLSKFPWLKRFRGETPNEKLEDLVGETEGLMPVVTGQLQDQLDAQLRIGEEIEQKGRKIKSIDSFGKALQHFLLSYPSATNTWQCLATAWNYCFISRSFAFKPSTWYMALVYPHYFRTAISSTPGKIHPPTEFNGGKRTVFELWRRRAGLLFGDRSLLTLRQFEKTILPVEGIAYELALERALKALIHYAESPSQLLDFFESSDLPRSGLPNEFILQAAPASTGISSITDNKLKRLNKKQRSFFRAYFATVLTETIQGYLREVITKNGGEEMAEATLSNEQLKLTASQWIDALKADEKAAQDPHQRKLLRERLVQIADQVANEETFSKAKATAEDLSEFLERKALDFDHGLMRALDPKNPQMNRFLTAERQLQKPKAMQRAARAEISSLFVDKPIGLLTILLLYAGVTDGSMLQPLHDEMFGPNSWFYGSRYLFFNEFAFGAILGLMANTWMKVQEDERIDSLGGFNKVPTVKDRDKGPWRYYFKNFLKNPSNRWAANQLHYTRLIWANIPAAFITMLTFNFLSLGRFDLGLFLSGYMVSFLTPLLGFNLKIEQAFELSTSWFAAKIPKRLRSHPLAQRYINARIQMQRLRFNLADGLYGALIGPALQMFEVMGTPEFGKRSFLNLTFYGWQPEEIVSAGLQKIVKYLGWIPGVEQAAEFCESLLTNNNTDLDPSRLMKNPVKPD